MCNCLPSRTTSGNAAGTHSSNKTQPLSTHLPHPCPQCPGGCPTWQSEGKPASSREHVGIPHACLQPSRGAGFRSPPTQRGPHQALPTALSEHPGAPSRLTPPGNPGVQAAGQTLHGLPLPDAGCVRAPPCTPQDVHGLAHHLRTALRHHQGGTGHGNHLGPIGDTLTGRLHHPHHSAWGHHQPILCPWLPPSPIMIHQGQGSDQETRVDV